jgi:hypothetical protein
MPAIDARRFDLKFKAVMAGSGLRVKECKESIIQLERLRARNAVSDARQSGICEKRFADKSNEWRVLARGAKLSADIDVSELSARLRCLRKRHLDDGSAPVARRLELLPRRL